MAKPIVKYKTYKQSAQVGGKIYGVPYLGDPQIASVTMQEVIDYCKLHNYSAAQLEAIMNQVISGVADLVARDGRPRNLSDLLKFEPKLKGTFNSLVSGVTDQKLVIRPRLLKEMRVNLPIDTFAWRNENDNTAPRIDSVAFDSNEYRIDSVEDFNTIFADTDVPAISISGSRLAPAGWLDTMSFDIDIERGGETKWHFRLATLEVDGRERVDGLWKHAAADQAADNNIKLSSDNTGNQRYWLGTEDDPAETPEFTGAQAGDILRVTFRRILEADGTLAVAEKKYTMA